MLQFDVFLGYDGIVPEATWVPIVCEIKNDGPSFNGMVEVSGGNLEQGQTRQLVVELPTGTTKRVVIPVFSSSRYGSWNVRLLDERGRVRSEQTDLRARKQIPAAIPLVGALPRTPGGSPAIRPVQRPESQPATARLQPTIFPDNPLVLEGMDSLYLNSEQAASLRVNQVRALLAWLDAGGHLIVAVEQPSDISSSPWLKSLFPCDLKDLRVLPQHPEFQRWLRSPAWVANAAYSVSSRPATSPRRNARPASPAPSPPAGASPDNPFTDLPDDSTFELAEMRVASGTIREGQVIVGTDDAPLVVTAQHGRGQVTALLFSPEREPFRSWKNLPTFWAKLLGVPAAWYSSSDASQPGGWSSDGIFGAMIDSRQVHKLPVGWLLLLLLAYLVVIGPLDQFWLKRIGRPMLTWITFPCYVALFSLLIYVIGYKLRAGESEWNELHLVDVLPKGERADLRGRTYASVYSPSNQRYQLRSQDRFATFRGEFYGTYAGGQNSEKTTVIQEGDSFRAEIFVPVWMSQLYVSDWWQSTPAPLNMTVTADGDAWQVKVQNRTDHKLAQAHLVIANFIIPLGEVPAKDARTFKVSTSQGQPLPDFVFSHGQGFQAAAQQRRRAFGASESGRIGDLPNSAIAASFLSQLGRQQNSMSRFIAQPGLDLSPVAARGGAILLAWADDYSPVKPIRQFSPRRSQADTLWRLAVPVQ